MNRVNSHYLRKLHLEIAIMKVFIRPHININTICFMISFLRFEFIINNVYPAGGGLRIRKWTTPILSNLEKSFSAIAQFT